MTYYGCHSILTQSQEEVAWRIMEFKKLRSELDLPRRELSKITGLKISTLNQIPYRNKTVSLLVLERMRAALEARKNQNNENQMGE